MRHGRALVLGTREMTTHTTELVGPTRPMLRGGSRVI